VSGVSTRPDRPRKTELERLTAKAKSEKWQQLMAMQLAASGIKFRPQYTWHTSRKFSADFVVGNYGNLIVEVDGGLFINGGHTRGARREYDYERDAEAMMLGFRVLRVSPRQVKQGKAIQWIQELLKQ
jgi:very-short-patch-repair endonuclease